MIVTTTGIMETNEWDFFLKLVKDCDEDPTPCPEWVNDRFRSKLAKLNKMNSYEKIFDTDNLELLKNLWASKTPYVDEEYDTICEGMKPFQKLVFMATFRPDQIVPSVRRYVKDTLGEQFVKQETLDVGKAFAETRYDTDLRLQAFFLQCNLYLFSVLPLL